MTRTPQPASPEAPLSDPVRRWLAWHVSGCAALSAAAGGLGLALVLGQVSYSFHAARPAVGYTGTALCAGAVLGLLLPRHIIWRRVRNRAPPCPQAGGVEANAKPLSGGSEIEFQFAASLAGVLLLVLAVVWVAIICLVGALDGYRAFLIEHFLLPPWLTGLLLMTPLWTGLFVLGAMASTLLVVFHGWQQLVSRPVAGFSGLWAALFLGATVGAAAAALILRSDLVGLLNLVLSFGAALVAVLPKPVGSRYTDVTWDSQPQAGRLLAPLVTAGLAALAAGTALVATTPAHFVTPQAMAGRLALLTAAGLIGVLVTCWTGRWSPSASQAAPLGVLVAAAVCGLAACTRDPDGWGANPWCSALVGVAVVVSMAVIGRRVTRILARIQPALAWTGVAVAAGLGLGMLVALSFTAGSGAGGAG